MAHSCRQLAIGRHETILGHTCQTDPSSSQLFRCQSKDILRIVAATEEWIPMVRHLVVMRALRFFGFLPGWLSVVWEFLRFAIQKRL
ncbi:hypothetical protein AVEN_84320-1 [Araneus ventricosus]|uniref:Uncharacterized protein n=1 Tax=Araneus ventricosus TaxID=182803 RepID=A0A4Y2FK69_ARAVE|nr:hypothetical protein AVEN_84320-1 [Araneus ventricosus]